MTKRVAIFQNTLTGGGRIQVLNEIIRILNQFSIVPDVYALRVNPSLTKGADLQYTIKKLPAIIRGAYELKVVSLNVMMRQFASKYHLLINSNNSLLFSPANTPTLAYIHFPREVHVDSNWASMAFPDGKTIENMNLGSRLLKSIDRIVYRQRKFANNQVVVANSKFTRSMICKAYKLQAPDRIKVIYPPINLEKWAHDSEDKNRSGVITLGRFTPDKRQLEQIEIARYLPDLEFRLLGFIGDKTGKAYFRECQDYIDRYNIHNVHLMPNLPVEEVRKHLSESQYFMHNLKNEPFGISVVEGIAAGCVPIVCDSGGPREIVPMEELRFRDPEEAVRKIQLLESKNLEPIKKTLQQGLTEFDVATFSNRMSSLLKQILEI